MAMFCSQCGKSLPPAADFCTHCGARLNKSRPPRREWQSKREKVVGHAVKRKTWLKQGVFAVGVLIGAGYLVIHNLPPGGSPVVNAQPVVTAGTSYARATLPMFDMQSTVDGGTIVVPLDIVREKKFVAFSYSGPNGLVPLLAYVSSEGKIVTAVSMCEPCNSSRFHISGDELVCNSCGTKWKIDNLDPISGSCGKYPPDALPNIVVGNQIRIDAQSVADWQPRV